MHNKKCKQIDKYKKVFELSPEAIAILDVRGVVFDVNNKVQEWLGYKRQDIIGKHITELPFLDQAGKKIIKAKFALRKQGKIISPYEIDFFTKQGKKIIGRVKGVLVFNQHKKPLGVIILISDITKEKQDEQAKEDFIATASHQLRNPLATMAWYSETLLSESLGKFNKRQKMYLQEICATSRQLTHLTVLLLDISKIELGLFNHQPRLVNLSQIADRVLAEMAQIIKSKQLKIIKSYPKKFPVFFNPDMAKIILQNLIANAAQYSTQQGKITIEIRKENNLCLIKIADHGCGIPKNQQDLIFDKFFQANNIKRKDNEGFGWGLYIVKSVVKQAGGKIWFQSKENIGSTFWVALPQKVSGKKYVKK